MKFSINVKKTVSTKVVCPSCKEAFPAPQATEEGVVSGVCPKCGEKFSLKLDGKYKELFSKPRQAAPNRLTGGGSSGGPPVSDKAKSRLTIVLVAIGIIFFAILFLKLRQAG